LNPIDPAGISPDLLSSHVIPLYSLYFQGFSTFQARNTHFHRQQLKTRFLHQMVEKR